MTYCFEVILNPCHKLVDFLQEQINKENPENGRVLEFGIQLKDRSEVIKAGCNGFIMWDTLLIDQLWVHKDLRKKGIGKDLVIKAHQLGKEQGCNVATLVTMNFQNAINFYLKLGYSIDFKREGQTNDKAMIYLSCPL